MRLTIVQYAGDYREAFERLSSGGKENYYAQRYSVNFVGSLAKKLDQVTVICGVTDEYYDVVLENGVRAIGAGLKASFNPTELVSLLAESRPTKLVLSTPLLPLLKWADANGTPTIVPLADSFRRGNFLEKLRQWQLAYYLNRPIVEWVGNHGINACLSLVKIGVAPDKIVPWDWPPSRRPSDYPSRTLRHDRLPQLLYVGSITEPKGVGDLLRAMVVLRQQGIEIRLSIIGRDPDGSLTKLANGLELGDAVTFSGILPNEDVPAAMRAADIVVVPSQHGYPEGLPLTIYEALSTRTPIVASDHPMFRGALVDGESALIFPAGNASALASTIVRLLHNAELYEQLSKSSEEAWQQIQLPVSWGALLEAWISNDHGRIEWIRDHGLASGRYAGRIRQMQSDAKTKGRFAGGWAVR